MRLFYRLHWRSIIALADVARRYFVCGIAVLLVAGAIPARAQHLSFRYYSQPEGLTNVGVDCLHQDPAGYIVACTEHGVYAYDGHRFENLGRSQGLPEGGTTFDIVFGRDGEVFVRYVDRVFVSRQRVSASQPLQSLTFRVASSDIGSFYEQHVGSHMAAWGRGVALVVNGRLAFLDPGDPGGVPRIQPLAPPPGLVGNASVTAVSIVNAGGVLWINLSDGRLCSFADGPGQCYGPADGLPASKWASVVAEPGGRFFARSPKFFATIDPSTHRASVELLPFQGGRYISDDYPLQLARSPSGKLVTQSADGIIVRDGSIWHHLNALSGIPQGSLTGLLFDRQGNLWFAGRGKGVFRAVGYGRWENRDKSDGLSDDTVWQMIRQPGGPLWIATDSGLDAIETGPTSVARRHLDTPGYSIAIGARGNLWQSEGEVGVLCLNVATGSVEHFAMPPVNHIVRGPGNRLWFATERGLFYIDDVPGAPRHIVAVPAVTGRVQVAAADADGSVWMLQDTRLTHLHGDGAVSVVVKDWLGQPLEPADMSLRSSHEIWVAGSGGGLFRVALSGDAVTSMVRFGPPDILSNTALSVLVDRRGWVWAGTGSGVSVFNGRRWISFDTNSGLIWNDLSQGGLYEDVDGSIWVATSQGLSHLLDPRAIFATEPFDVTISSIRLGDQLFPQHTVKYTTEPLLLDFGTSDYRSELSLTYRYKLEGVDKNWAETPDGHVRYPFVPPGRHRLLVVAVNSLTHQSSRPASFDFRVGKPWWLTWPVEMAGGAFALLVIYGAGRLRYHSILRQQRILQGIVEQRTEEIRVAQAALLFQATQDTLTGLLTRNETEKRLAAMLTRADRRDRLIIGLVDIDHFKRINDTFGHLGGDEVLQAIGARALAVLRPGEYAGRYGGEEVLLVLDDEDGCGDARIIAFHEAIRGTPFPVNRKLVSMTCSIGISWARAHDDWKSLIGRADEALYLAKREGRDRVVEANARYVPLPALFDGE